MSINKFTIEEVIIIYEEKLHRLGLVERIKLIDWCKDLGTEVVLWAIEQAVNINRKAYIYINKILIHYKENIVESIPV